MHRAPLDGGKRFARNPLPFFVSLFGVVWPEKINHDMFAGTVAMKP